jgi:ABC-2 type transport system permease protein
MNVFKFELNREKLSLIYWAVGIVSLIIFFMGFYPLMQDQQASMDLVLKYYPEELLRAFGMSGSESLTTLKGYLPFVFVFLQLLLAVFASIKGFATLSQEESDQTADFLFSKPITRKKLFIIKIAVGILILMIVWLVSVASIHAFSFVFASDEMLEMSQLFPLYVSLFFFMLIYFSVGMLLSMMSKYVRSTLGYAMGLSFLTYALYSLVGIIDSKLFGYFTPFYYFEASSIISSSGLDTFYTIVSLLIIVVGMFGSYRLFLKRNLTSI